MFNRIKLFYQRQFFCPGIFGLFLNPFYFARLNLYRAMIEYIPFLSGRLLDVGCGTKPYQQIVNVQEYLGLDVDNETTRMRGIADFFYDGFQFPFNSESFDSILCNQVLEHVFNPDQFLREISRVLRSKGKLLITVPFVWDEHEQPYDYARYSSFGLRSLLEKSGFKIIEQKKLGGNAALLFQLVNAYLFKVTQKWPRILKLFFVVTVMASINVLGIIAGRLLPDNPDLFLDQIVLAEKHP